MIPRMFAAVSRTAWAITRTSPLSASQVAFADSALSAPSRWVLCAIWRWRFESSTRSSSITPMVPTPAAAR